MADARGGVNVLSQFGFEATPGAGATRDKILKSLNFSFENERNNSNFTAQGYRVPTTKSTGKEMSTGSYNGILCYNAFPYVSDGLFNAAAPAEIAALDAFRREWIAGQKTRDMTRKTFSWECGDDIAVDVYNYGQLKSFQMQTDQDNFSIDGSAVAQTAEPDQVQTAGATEIESAPVQRNDIAVFIDDTAAGLGTTQLINPVDETFNLHEKYLEVFFHNRGNNSYTGVIEQAGEPTFGFTQEANAQARSLRAAVLSDVRLRKYIRWEALSSRVFGQDGGNDVNEMIRLELAVEFTNVTPIGPDPNAPYAFKFDCVPMADNDLGTYLKITSICELAAL